MDKLKMMSPDWVDENIKRIGELFPNAVTERVVNDAEGNAVPQLAIDFDVLKQELSHVIVEGREERYQFSWPDKKKAIQLANSPTPMTLRPNREESVDFDTTQNLYIEGDNLEVLKLLRENYLGKVKMIYIDPPYNTGNDFVYNDDFAEDADAFLNRDAQRDEEGNRLVKNLDSNGRFHTDWLNMIYPRLKVARELLSEEGVIFVSIDDNEVRNLRNVCDDLFGEKNFVVQIIWKKRSTPPNDQVIGAAHEYIVVYAKNLSELKLNLRERSAKQLARYQNPDNHPKGPWTPGDLGANVKGGRYVQSLYFPIINPTTGEQHFPPQNGNWRFSQSTIAKLMENNEIFFGEDNRGRPKLKRFLCDVKEGITYTSLWDFVPLNTQGSSEMTEIFGNLAVFDNPKPVGLVKEICKLGLGGDDLILDFFSGSATTAHAVMQLNAEDGGKRRFIMVQLPEACEPDSEAYKAGYKNICEIGKERIRRAGKKIKNEAGLMAADLDIGFRVLKLDTSNMKEVYYTPAEVVNPQFNLEGLLDNIKEDRTPEDLLFQVMPELDIPLTEKIETLNWEGRALFSVADGYLLACFDAVDEALIEKIARQKPHYAVFRDSSFANDSVLVNFDQIFATFSPTTIRRVL